MIGHGKNTLEHLCALLGTDKASNFLICDSQVAQGLLCMHPCMTGPRRWLASLQSRP